MPIYGQIQSFGVTNVLLIAVRVFGKLGVGGLISAYKTTAQLTLENCAVIEKRLTFTIAFSLIIKT
jgi:putative IMPACT (imprinted ancient) family translation regulator